METQVQFSIQLFNWRGAWKPRCQHRKHRACRGMTCLDRRESPAVPPLKSSCLRSTGSQPSKRADASFPQPGRQASRAAGQIEPFSAQLSVNSGKEFKWGIERGGGGGRVRKGGRGWRGLVAPGQSGCWVSLEATLSMSAQRLCFQGAHHPTQLQSNFWITRDFKSTFLPRLSASQIYSSRNGPVASESSSTAT